MRSQAKDDLYEQFARVGKVVASPKRIEVLDLLAQGERSVEALAELTGMGMANTSAHLQVLRHARLVEARKEGNRVLYRLAGDEVIRFLLALEEAARARLTEVAAIVRDRLADPDELEPVRPEDLLERARRNEVVVIDVRPTEEYDAGHIPGAVSIPMEELDARLGELPRDAEVIAYCRGSFCVLAPDALRLLRSRGIDARRLEGGLLEWRAAGLPVMAVGE